MIEDLWSALACETRLLCIQKPFITTLKAALNVFLCTNFKAVIVAVKLRAVNKNTRTPKSFA